VINKVNLLNVMRRTWSKEKSILLSLIFQMRDLRQMGGGAWIKRQARREQEEIKRIWHHLIADPLRITKWGMEFYKVILLTMLIQMIWLYFMANTSMMMSQLLSLESSGSFGEALCLVAILLFPAIILMGYGLHSQSATLFIGGLLMAIAFLGLFISQFLNTEIIMEQEK